jgi:hypothetical protein
MGIRNLVIGQLGLEYSHQAVKMETSRNMISLRKQDFAIRKKPTLGNYKSFTSVRVSTRTSD